MLQGAATKYDFVCDKPSVSLCVFFHTRKLKASFILNDVTLFPSLYISVVVSKQNVSPLEQLIAGAVSKRENGR